MSSKMAESGDRSGVLAGVLAGLGGTAAGASLANSDAANALLVRWLTRNGRKPAGVDFRVPVFAGADFDLTHGSGEAVMASRISSMLNRHGIGSYYVNSQGGPSIHGLNDGTEGFLHGSWNSDTVKANGPLWARENKINGRDLGKLRNIRSDLYGKSSNALDMIVGKMTAAGVPEKKVIKLLRSGTFNGFTPGELLDTFKVVGNKGIKDIAAGRSHITPRASLDSRMAGKRLPYAMTGEAGMDYSSMAWGNADRIAANTYPFPATPKTRNLALDTQFQANYRSSSDKLIPGSGMYDPGTLRRSRLARWWKYNAPGILGGGEKRKYVKAIERIARENGIDPTTLGKNTKYMLISTGAAGANAAEKLRMAEKAFKGDPNVRVILQYGRKNPLSADKGLDLYTNNGIKEEIARINRERPGFVMAFDRDPAYGILARNVDLHGAYGGSSSITEALANTNPTVAMTDTHLNMGNNSYGKARRGIKQVDSGRVALGRLIRAGKGMDTVVNTRDGGGQTLGQAVNAFGLNGMTPDKFDKLERDGVQAMRDAMYSGKGKFDRGAVRAANKMLAEQRMRNKTFLDTVRQAVLKAVDRSDASNYRHMKPGVLKFMSRLNRRSFATAAGRRIGLPVALLSGLGLGSGAYALTRNKK